MHSSAVVPTRNHALWRAAERESVPWEDLCSSAAPPPPSMCALPSPPLPPPLCGFQDSKTPQHATGCTSPPRPGRRSQILQRGLVKKFCLLFAPFRMNYFVYAIMCFVSTDFECNPGILIIHTIFLQILCIGITQVSSIIRVLKRNQARGKLIDTILAEVAVMRASGRASVKINV